MAIDASPTAESTSDESSIAVGHFEPMGDEQGLVLCDVISGRWRGIHLVDRIVAAISQYHPETLLLELNKQHGAELLLDTIILRAELLGVEMPNLITPFQAANTPGAKIRRIRRIESDLIYQAPPLLRIRGGSFVDKLFNEVRNFTFERKNRGRQDNILDSIAFLAGFR